MTPTRGAEELANVPKCRKAVMCLTEKIGALDKPHSSMSSSTVGCALNVGEINHVY